MKKQWIDSVYRANYQKVLKNTFDHRNYEFQTADCLPIIASLSFVGRLDEAERYFLLYQDQLSHSDQVACRFFLGINLVRQSDPKKALKLLLQSREQKSMSAVDRFYFYQGLAFYKYFHGQLQSCKRLVEVALDAAISARFFYGRILALDMMGHVQVSLGSVYAGTKQLEQAKELATEMKYNWITSAIAVSILNYRAQYGHFKKQSVENLQAALKESDLQDVYSQSYLLLELARQFTLRANFKESEKTLEVASKLIYQSQHNKQRLILALRLADLEYQRGDSTAALNHISLLKNQNFGGQLYRDIWPQVLGLEQKILIDLGFPKNTMEANLASLEIAVKKYPGYLPKAYSNSSIKNTEDFIHHYKLLYKDQKVPKDEVFSLADAVGCQLFLVDYFNLKRGESAIIIHSATEQVLLYNKDSLDVHTLKQKSIVAKILLLLATRVCSKDVLVEQVWGYQYDPLRHDPMLYTAMQALRKVLGDKSDWVLRSEEGYYLDPSVRMIQTSENQSKIKEAPSSFEHVENQLNPRQHRFLSHFPDIESGVSVSRYADYFQISKVSAFRDLDFLYKNNFLHRLGKARATRYFLL